MSDRQGLQGLIRSQGSWGRSEERGQARRRGTRRGEASSSRTWPAGAGTVWPVQASPAMVSPATESSRRRPDGGRVGYSQQWNISIQRELPWLMVLEAGYIGTKSTGLQANELRQANQLPYSALALGDTLNVWINNQDSIPAAAKAIGARYPYQNEGEWIPTWATLVPHPTVIYWSNLYSWNSPLGFSSFNSLQLQLNKRLSNGVQWLANYTWSKTIDNMNSAFGDTWGMNGGRPLDYYNLALEKSISQFDRRHYVKIGGSWDLPVGQKRRFGNGMNKALDFVVGGWTIQYIGNYSSGEPLGFGATGTPAGNFQTNRVLINNPNGDSLKLGTFDPSKFQMNNISVGGIGEHRYINTALLKDPPRYVRGNSSRMLTGSADSLSTATTRACRRTSSRWRACASSFGRNS